MTAIGVPLCGFGWVDDHDGVFIGDRDGYGGHLTDPTAAPVLVRRSPPPPPPIGRRPTMAGYGRALDHFRAHPDRVGGLTHLRDLTIAGVRAGTIGAHEVLCQVRPAAVAVAALAEQSVAAVGRLIVGRIRAAVGESPELWAELIDRIESWTGSLLSLLIDIDSGSEDKGYRSTADSHPSLPPSRPQAWTGHLWRPANILLALAPPECARYFLASAVVRRAGLAQRMAGFMPLSRPLVEHTVSERGSGRARQNLAANAFTPDAVLAELLRWVGEPAIATAVREHEFAGGAVRFEAFDAVRERPEAARRSLEALLPYGQQQFLELLLAVPGDDPVWIHTLIKMSGTALDPATRRAAYARLAEVCEPEAVWALELAHAGSLEAMEPEVRASMTSDDAAQLAELLRSVPFHDQYQDVNSAADQMRREELLDHPLPWLR